MSCYPFLLLVSSRDFLFLDLSSRPFSWLSIIVIFFENEKEVVSLVNSYPEFFSFLSLSSFLLSCSMLDLPFFLSWSYIWFSRQRLIFPYDSSPNQSLTTDLYFCILPLNPSLESFVVSFPSGHRLLLDEDDVLSEVTQSKAVPEEVKEWLASTFTKNTAAQKRRSEDKPKFRTVANAIRAGIAVDKYVFFLVLVFSCFSSVFVVFVVSSWPTVASFLPKDVVSPITRFDVVFTLSFSFSFSFSFSVSIISPLILVVHSLCRHSFQVLFSSRCRLRCLYIYCQKRVAKRNLLLSVYFLYYLLVLREKEKDVDKDITQFLYYFSFFLFCLTYNLLFPLLLLQTFFSFPLNFLMSVSLFSCHNFVPPSILSHMTINHH